MHKKYENGFNKPRDMKIIKHMENERKSNGNCKM